MGSMEVVPPINSNIPLVWIIIPKLDAQQTLRNTFEIQMDPLVNPPNIVVDDIRDITLELNVDKHTVTNKSAPQVMDLSPSSLKAIKPKNTMEGDLDYDHH